MRVMVADDAVLFREGLSRVLAEAGFEVTAASDGDEALAILRQDAGFQLLFTDIRMPGSADGWELAREAKKLIPGLRVIYATGLGDAGDGLGDGEWYVRKPYNLKDLRQALGKLGFDG